MHDRCENLIQVSTVKRKEYQVEAGRSEFINCQKMKLNAQNVKLNLRKLYHWIWITRYWILIAVIFIFINHRIFVHFWYLELPKNVPSIICSFGRGKYWSQVEEWINN